MRLLPRIAAALAVFSLLACGAPSENAGPYRLEQSAGATQAQGTDAGAARGQIVAVLHPELPAQGSPHAVAFASTLAVLNTGDAPLDILRVDVVSSNGTTAHAYLQSPLRLAPHASLRAFIDADRADGPEPAYFSVEWSGVEPPYVQAIMLGAAGTHSYSIVTEGRPVH